MWISRRTRRMALRVRSCGRGDGLRPRALRLGARQVSARDRIPLSKTTAASDRVRSEQAIAFAGDCGRPSENSRTRDCRAVRRRVLGGIRANRQLDESLCRQEHSATGRKFSHSSELVSDRERGIHSPSRSDLRLYVATTQQNWQRANDTDENGNRARSPRTRLRVHGDWRTPKRRWNSRQHILADCNLFSSHDRRALSLSGRFVVRHESRSGAICVCVDGGLVPREWGRKQDCRHSRRALRATIKWRVLYDLRGFVICRCRFVVSAGSQDQSLDRGSPALEAGLMNVRIASASWMIVTTAAMVIACASCALGTTEPLTYGDGRLHRDSITSGGITRTFSIYVPTKQVAKRAALVGFHGAGGSGADMRMLMGIEGAADVTGSVIVYPDAVGASARNTWALGCTNCTWADAAGIDDYSFM